MSESHSTTEGRLSDSVEPLAELSDAGIDGAADTRDDEGGASGPWVSRWLHNHLGCWLMFRRHEFHPWMLDGQYRWRYCRRCPVGQWSPQ